MEKLSKRILIKICSTRPLQWAARKIVMRMVRRAQKAPAVQERIKALMAAAPEEDFRFEYFTAVGNELAKSKFIKFDAFTPEEVHPRWCPPEKKQRIEPPLNKVTE